MEAPYHHKIYFCFRSSNPAEIFKGDVSRTKQLTVKISAPNIEPTKIYLKIKGQNVGVRASPISLLFQTLENSDWFLNVAQIRRYNSTDSDSFLFCSFF